jgi:omega-6 fatty acid desaturase (delta-12 desaturase)
MSDLSSGPRPTDSQPGIRSLIAPFESAIGTKSAVQIVTSLGLFIAAWAIMYWSQQVSYLLTLALALPTAGLLVRVFIVQHDCGHGSFFKSRRANDIVGAICSLMTFTPYANWRRLHNLHHGSWNNLDRRQGGTDLYSECLTVEEYWARPRWRRFTYRTVRHPIVGQLIIPPLVFLFFYRTPFDTPKAWVKERRSVHWTNLAILSVFGALSLWLGVWHVLLIQVPVIALTAIIGVLLFSLQHRFDGAVWARQDEWNVTTAALHGCSFFKLPRILQWFSGNIGFHHVHHLSPRVPNYRLEDCHDAIPALQEANTVSWSQALKAIRLILWDEANRQMVTFAQARAAMRRRIEAEAPLPQA